MDYKNLLVKAATAAAVTIGVVLVREALNSVAQKAGLNQEVVVFTARR